VAVHEARAGDVREVERLSLAEFSDVFDRAFGRRPAATRLEVLVRLRASHPQPAAGTLVARTPDGALVGYCRYATAGMREAGPLRQLAALRPSARSAPCASRSLPASRSAATGQGRARSSSASARPRSRGADEASSGACSTRSSAPRPCVATSGGR